METDYESLHRDSNTNLKDNIKAIFSWLKQNFGAIISLISIILSSYTLSQLNSTVPVINSRLDNAQQSTMDIENRLGVVTGQSSILVGLSANLFQVNSVLDEAKLLSNLSLSQSTATSQQVQMINDLVETVSSRVRNGLDTISSFSCSVSNMSLKINSLNNDIDNLKTIQAQLYNVQRSYDQLTSDGIIIESKISIINITINNLLNLLKATGCLDCGRILGMPAGSQLDWSKNAPYCLNGSQLIWNQCGKPNVTFTWIASAGNSVIPTTMTLGVLFDDQPYIIDEMFVPGGATVNKSGLIVIPQLICWTTLQLYMCGSTTYTTNGASGSVSVGSKSIN